jgi:inner membrane transporter RhtA
VGFVLAALVSQEVGASIAVLLFPQAGPAGMVTLRLFFSAVILLAVARPKLRGIDGRGWMLLVAFAIALTLMNTLFYQAISRIALGPAVTIEVLGPLVLSVVVARRASAWLWAVLAFAGVAVLGAGGFGSMDPVGVGFALGAAIAWAFYILATARVGQRFRGLDGLAIGMAIGAVMSLPLGIADAGATLLEPHILGLGAAVALLSSAIPYGLELTALRRMSASAFSVLMSCAPAIATAAGAVLLGQLIGPVQGIGIALVMVASVGAVLAAGRAQREIPPVTGPIDLPDLPPPSQL